MYTASSRFGAVPARSSGSLCEFPNFTFRNFRKCALCLPGDLLVFGLLELSPRSKKIGRHFRGAHPHFIRRCFTRLNCKLSTTTLCESGVHQRHLLQNIDEFRNKSRPVSRCSGTWDLNRSPDACPGFSCLETSDWGTFRNWSPDARAPGIRNRPRKRRGRRVYDVL